MNPLAFVPSWVTAAIIAALVLAIGIEEVRIASLKTDHAEYVAGIEKQRHIQAQAALAEQSRRQQAFDDEATHARKEKAELEATVARLADTADGLRGDVATFQRRASASTCPTVRSQSQPSTSATDLLAGLYLGSVETNRQLASYAQELRRVGSACERSADALTNKSH